MDDLIPALRERAADPVRRTTVPAGLARRPQPDLGALASAVTSLSEALRRTVEATQRGETTSGRPYLHGLELGPPAAPDIEPLPDPAERQALDDVEARLGVRLPADVRRLYLEVADGRFGPGSGLLPLREVIAATMELRAGEALPVGRVWPASLVALVRDDPGWTCVDASSGAIVAWDPEGLAERSGEAAFARSFHERSPSVMAWLDEWVTSPTLAEETAQAGVEIRTLRFGGIELPVAIGAPPAGVAPASRMTQTPAASRHAVRRTVDSSAAQPPVPDARALRRQREKVAGRLPADASTASLAVSADGIPRASVPATARGLLEEALARVSAHRLAWHMPRKPTGAPDATATLALVRLGDPDRRPGTREPWLIARAAVESTTIRFTVSVEALISENESHRWDTAPWRWAGDDGTPPSERWGTTPDEARPVIEALDQGRWLDALPRRVVELDDAVAALLAGGDAAPDLADLTDAWRPRVVSNMARLAPWALAGATGELRRGKPMRLFGLGGVTQQRKPGIFLSGDASRPRLSLEWTASNERVRESAWTRPLDLDLVVTGLIDHAAIPV